MQPEPTARLNLRIQEAIGLDTSTLGPSALIGAVKQRCGAHPQCLDRGQINWRTYLAKIDSDPTELTALIDVLVVPETWFFRDPGAFDALRAWAVDFFPQLPPNERVNLLSLPCATGEEPYSMVMTLLDAGICPNRFRVIAMDISEPLLQRMDGGLYGANSFRSTDLSFRAIHFSREHDGRHRLKPRLREQTVIRRGNLFAPFTFAEFAPFHVIFCRNLLIYFNRPHQERARSILADSLVDGGLLFVGHAEGAAMSQDGIRQLGVHRSFGFVKTGPDRGAKPNSGRRTAFRNDKSQSISRSHPHSGSVPDRETGGRGMNRTENTAFQHRATASSSGRTRLDQLDLTTIRHLADIGRLSDAADLCEAELRDRAPGPDAFFLLGLIRDSMKQYDAAAECYRKAIYLEPDNSDALLHLALLRSRQGANDEARRLELRAKRVFQRSKGTSS